MALSRLVAWLRPARELQPVPYTPDPWWSRPMPRIQRQGPRPPRHRYYHCDKEHHPR